jgi:hypothetical protein
MPAELTKNVFEPHLNTKFWLRGGDAQPQAIDLIQLADGHSTPKQEQFSLLFRGDRNYVFPQQIFPLKHDAIGELDLFLVPVGRDETGTFYQAVFNRLV